MPGLFQELKRRNVFKVGTAYVVLAWLVAQAIDVFLDPLGAPEWVIKTILMVLIAGLPLVLLFAWAYELTPEGIKREKDVDRNQSITHQTGQRLNLAIIFILVLALGYFAVDKFVLEPARHPEAAETTVEADAAPAGAPAKSIAVLPFVNMSSDPEQEYFSDGISEEILNSLAKIKDLKVAGRTSPEPGSAPDRGHAGRGAHSRGVGAQSRRHGTYHGPADPGRRRLPDVFAIQDEIARAILTQLKAALLDEEQALVSAPRADSEAYDLYLLARQRMYERTGPTIESAAELLDRAIALDPDYAPAYAQRGIATLLLKEGSGSYGDIPHQQALAQGKLYLDKALQLDPLLPEAWAGMGLYHDVRPLGTEEAVNVLRKALAMNPSMIDASNWLHNSLQALGRPAEAHAVLMEMVERDPLYRPGIRNLINSYNWFGEHDKALAFLEEVRPLIPNDATIQSSLAAVHLDQGRIAEALEESERAVDLQPSNSVARLTRSFIWLASHQLERVAADGEEWTPIVALTLLGRVEEATQLAYQRAKDIADTGTLLGFLNITGRSEEAVNYIEARWDSLDALEKDHPPYGGLGYFVMLDVALAYSRVGNAERFDDAMARVHRVHDELRSQGVNNPNFFMSEAARYALAGDLDTSVDFVERAVSRGLITVTPRIAREWPALADLEGNPRFEAVQARMMEHLNAERAALGLDPVEA
jgi:TolB-like protein/Tfp pilus assembly protein PilF